MTLQFDWNELMSQCDVAANTSLAANPRLEAAANCSWIVKRAGFSPGLATLSRAVISRFVDDLKDTARTTSPYADLNYWRHFDLADLRESLNQGQIDARTSLTCAQLLFDAARHPDAVPFFERALKLSPSPESVILACYNLEVIAREQGNLALTEKAIGLLTIEFVSPIPWRQFAFPDIPGRRDRDSKSPPRGQGSEQSRAETASA